MVLQQENDVFVGHTLALVSDSDNNRGMLVMRRQCVKVSKVHGEQLEQIDDRSLVWQRSIGIHACSDNIYVWYSLSCVGMRH